MKSKVWVTKQGNKIKYKDLENSHLLNIITWIEKTAKEGFSEHYGGGSDVEDFWYEEVQLTEEETKEHFNYDALVKEAKRRGLM